MPLLNDKITTKDGTGVGDSVGIFEGLGAGVYCKVNSNDIRTNKLKNLTNN